MIRCFILAFTLLLTANSVAAEQKSLKILHLTFHQGCAKEFEDVAKVFGHEVTTWWILNLPPYFFDGVSKGNALYNIGHDRAERIWNLHKKTFEEFDVIVTSDTAPLSRIFLQNGYTKPLIIWVCCRFDYFDLSSLDCDFPDAEFYQMFDQAKFRKNVTMIGYTEFEREYAKSKGVDIGPLVITPCAPKTIVTPEVSSIPTSIAKEETFFLPPYWNEMTYMNLSEHCKTLGISSYCGRYNGPGDLKDFKGIIHLPYAWSNLALFENLISGIPYFLPSKKFLKTLLQTENYWHTNPAYLLNDQFWLSEWYKTDRRGIFVYFDSWADLQRKIRKTNYPVLREKIKAYAKKYQADMLGRWEKVFNELQDASP